MYAPIRTCLIACLTLAVCSTLADAQPRPPFPLPPKPPFGEKPPLGEKPPVPSELLDKITEQLNSGDLVERLDAAEQLPSLGAFGSSQVAGQLAKALADDNGHVRMTALHALAAMGPDAKSALAKVQQHADDAQSEYERTLATWAAARISGGDGADQAVPLLIKALQSDDAAVSSLATEALAVFGRQSHPQLIQALQNADTRSSFLLIDVLGQTGARSAVDEIAKRLTSDSVGLRAGSAEALGKIGPSARRAAPALQKLLTTDASAAVRARAADSIGDIGEANDELLAALAKAVLEDKSDVVAKEAMESLVQLDADGQVVLKLVPKLLTDKRATVVSAALSALSEQGKDALPIIDEALGEESTRYWALLVINDLGPDAASTAPKLGDLLKSANTLDRREILMALSQIGPDAKATVDAVASQLDDKDRGVQYAATFAAGKIGQSSDAAIDGLKANLRSDDPLLRMTSAWALAKLETNNPLAGLRAMKELSTGMMSDDTALQQAAAQCLADLKPGPKQLPVLLPQLAKSFGSDDPLAQLAAVDALEGLLGQADVSEPISAALKNEVTRPIAAVAASRLGPKAKGATPALAAALSDSRPSVRRDAAIALAAIGADAAAAAEQLQKALHDDSDSDVRNAAAFALGKIGSSAKEAAAELQRALTDPATSSTAAWALAQIAAGDSGVAKAVVPQLVSDLDSHREDRRIAAANALARFGGLAESAKAALQYAVDDPSHEVRTAARQALQAVAGQ